MSYIKNLVFCIGMMAVMFVPAPAFADGGDETGMGIIVEGQATVKRMKIGGGEFTVTRRYTHYGDQMDAVKAKFSKIKLDLTYELIMKDGSEKTEKIIGTRKGSITMKPGVETVTINADKEVMHVLKTVKKKGAVIIKVSLKPGDQIFGGDYDHELGLVNEEWQKQQADHMMKNSGLMDKFMQDYQQYMIDNAASGKDGPTLLNDFYKKYPQYKGLMPE